MQMCKELLSNKGLKKTKYKIKIIKILMDSLVPMSANEIVRLLTPTSKINISTVYRIFDEFLKTGLVLKSYNKKGESILCFNKFKNKHIHAHLSCNICGHLCCCDMGDESILKNFNCFTTASVQLKIEGVCDGCSSKKP